MQVVFFLLIPYLNMIVDSCDKIMLKWLVATCLTAFSLIAVLPVLNEIIPNAFYGVTMPYVPWFCLIYIIGAYIRLYVDNSKWLQLSGVIMLILTVTSILLGDYLTHVTGNNYIWFFVSECNKPFAVIGAIGLFFIFRGLRLKNSVIINYISKSTFGTLLIHACNSGMRKFLWYDVFMCADVEKHSAYWFDAIISVLVIYCVCFLIDALRRETVEKIIDRWDTTPYYRNGDGKQF